MIFMPAVMSSRLDAQSGNSLIGVYSVSGTQHGIWLGKKMEQGIWQLVRTFFSMKFSTAIMSGQYGQGSLRRTVSW